MTFEERLKTNQLLFIPTVTSLLSTFEYGIKENQKRKLECTENQLIKDNGKMNIEEMENWIDNYFFHHQYDYLLLHSIFISLYSSIESHLASISILMEEMKPQVIKISDLKSYGIIDKYRKYLHLLFDISEANKGSLKWNEFEKFQFLRNKIVHNECNLCKDGNNYRSTVGFQLLRKYTNVRILEEGKFFIYDSKFIEDFGKLIIEISQKINFEIIKKNKNDG